MHVLPRHLYVHVPFCARRCSYCDFAIAVRRETPVAEYIRSVSAELDLRFGHADRATWTLDTLYFGGGTPSRLGAAGVTSLLEAIRARLTLAGDAEVTLETNPDDVTIEAARAWRDAGVNRVSLGAQSFDDRALRWMHRVHDAAQIPRSVADLREAGLDNISVDLIFALPAALLRDWRRDLDCALALEPSHVSLYGLTVHERTPLARWRDRGEVAEAPDESYADEFLEAHEVLTAAGLDHYEVSSYARPGCRSRHNAAYWACVPWGGVGPSAHEFDGIRRRWNVGAYAEWERRVRERCDPREGEEMLSAENRDTERVYLGLRTSAGLDVSVAQQRLAAPWAHAGWATLSGGRLKLTPEGWLRLDELAAALT